MDVQHTTNAQHASPLHVLLFPFMSKGHTISLLQLARLLLRRPAISVTIVTTPQNRPFVAEKLSGTAASIVSIPFPHNIPEIPPCVESTDKLPSISLYVPFCRATKLMQPDFEKALQIMPPVSFMVSDGFLWWTLESASKFGFPRLVSYGMNAYAYAVLRSLAVNKLLLGPEAENELITLTDFPWIKITKSDFEPMFSDPNPTDPRFELFMDQIISASNSHGYLINSFYELEPKFIDYLNRTDNGSNRGWCVGPLFLADAPADKVNEPEKKPYWIRFLDQKLEQGCSVLYVAFGSQADISIEQLKEIAKGLEESKVNFLWVVRNKDSSELEDGFEDSVRDRGVVVREWVNQREILMHQSVRGFLSHCGWNSVLESICVGVPILAWPMMAEQPLNARLVAEEIKVGLRVETCDGRVLGGFVKGEDLRKMVTELMEGDKGKEVRKRVKEVTEMARAAMEEEKGSSWQTLDMLINEVCSKRGD